MRVKSEQEELDRKRLSIILDKEEKKNQLLAKMSTIKRVRALAQCEGSERRLVKQKQQAQVVQEVEQRNRRVRNQTVRMSEKTYHGLVVELWISLVCVCVCVFVFVKNHKVFMERFEQRSEQKKAEALRLAQEIKAKRVELQFFQAEKQRLEDIKAQSLQKGQQRASSDKESKAKAVLTQSAKVGGIYFV